MSLRRLFPATRRGARAVRHAAEQWLAEHLTPEERRDGDLLPTAALLIAELAANAALHGRVRGREARLVAVLSAEELWVEVTDARGERLPVLRADADGESGRGLMLVDALADDWGVLPHRPGGKTVWAVCRRCGAHVTADA
ncbi:ATP-binding protein [Streptomyces sp. NPDC017979]|uniref:ATP-binding protein n=1 Tax=Streptomyces sp. NPDC017979 TaxID=3365024 RepID=UPI0037B190C3